MAYRNDSVALAARLHDLQADVERSTRARDEVAALLGIVSDEERAARHFANEPPRRKRVLLIAIAFGLLAALGIALLAWRETSKHAQREADGADNRGKLERFSAAMCQCISARCAEAVMQDYEAWSRRAYSFAGKPPTPLPEHEQRYFSWLGEKLYFCYAEATQKSTR